MDKYEYRVKTEQMLEYMENKQYKKAKDTIAESLELLSTSLEKDFEELVKMELDEAKENILI